MEKTHTQNIKKHTFDHTFNSNFIQKFNTYFCKLIKYIQKHAFLHYSDDTLFITFK